MSKAGAEALRQRKDYAQGVADIETKGVLVSAMEAWTQKEQRRVEHAGARLRHLAATLGIPWTTEAYVLDDFEKEYPPHNRVCVNVAGLTLNYYAGDKDHAEAVWLIIGKCISCGLRPNLLPVRELADLAYPATPHGQHDIETFRCSRCQKYGPPFVVGEDQ